MSASEIAPSPIVTPTTPAPHPPRAMAAAAARILLEIEAVLVRPEEPFTLTSGRQSPVYVDCRRIISFPRARRRLMQFAVERIEAAIGCESIDAIAGGETAGIPFAAWIAEMMGLPMLYVRKQPKGFGRNAQIEGYMPPGSRVLLVEDLATDGGSKLVFVEALRKAEAHIRDTLVVFHYGIFTQSIAALAQQGVRLHGLTTWWDILHVVEEDGRIGSQALAEVRRFLEAPENWTPRKG